MASRKVEDLRPELQSVWNDTNTAWTSLYPNLAQPFLTCTYRSNAEQDALYAQGRTTEGNIITNSRSGQSAHNTIPSSAFDIGFKKSDGDLDWNHNLFSMFNDLVQKKYFGKVTWGGIFKSIKDSPHFELTDWKTYKNA